MANSSPSAGAPAKAPGRALGAVRRERAAAPEPEPAPAPEPEAEAGPEPEPAPAPRAVAEPEPDPEPDPEPPPSTAGPEATDVDGAPAAAVALDEVVVAWAGALDALPVPVRRGVQEAQPLEVDGDVVVFGVPPHFLDRAQTRFRQEADAIRAALAAPLGVNLRFKLVPHEGFLSGGAADAPAPAPVAGGAAVDSLSSFQDRFGATVVEEQRH
jgi:hypothetical protein